MSDDMQRDRGTGSSRLPNGGEQSSSAYNDNISSSTSPSGVGLRHEPAHWHEYNTNVKMRWANRTLLEVFVTEFRDRTSEYYQWAIHKGYCCVNGKLTSPHYRLKQSDRIINRIHRHEPAVTSDPVRILHRDDAEGRLVVVKPGSIPVHPAGRYYKMTLLEMLKAEHGLQHVLPSNRLDRLTSGIMVCSTRKETAHRLSEQFAMGKVRKAYVCRVRGHFPAGQTTVNQPLLHCDRQTGISIVHPLGKYSETIFNLLSYDPQTDSSVVYCRPITGRTHQIRVHAQFLGHPIVNDPVYNHPLWQKYPPDLLQKADLREDRWKIEPASTLSVYGSAELDNVIEGLKLDKDTKDDWARWRDEVMFGKLLDEESIERISVPGFNAQSPTAQRQRAQIADEIARGSDKTQYCSECKIPLVPDPKPEELFIYLHAIKYQTEDWTYEDQMPWWALPDWKSDDKGRDSFSSPEYVMPPAFGLVGRGDAMNEKTSVEELPKLTALFSLSEHDVPQMSDQNETKCHPRVVLQVMGGMEDFAVADVERQLSDAMRKQCHGKLQIQRNTGHLFVAQGEYSLVALQLFDKGRLCGVDSAFIEIASPVMPTSLLSSLAKEKKDLTEARSKANLMKKRDKDAVVDESVHSNEIKESEKSFILAMQEAWNVFDSERELAFTVWKKASKFDVDNVVTLTRKPRFRATVDRRGYSLPTITTAHMERAVGDLTWQWLNGATPSPQHGAWEVDLIQPDVNVVLKLLPGFDVEQEDNVPGEASSSKIDAHWRTTESNWPGRFVFMLAYSQTRYPEHRLPQYPNHLVHDGTALARFRAYTLVSALPLLGLEQQEEKKKGLQTTEMMTTSLKVWEPCAGTGALAIEMAAALRRRRIRAKVYASDIVAGEVDKAREMMKLCGCTEKDDVSLATVDATDVNEVAKFIGLDHVTEQPSVAAEDDWQGTLDGIVTDLPWGRRVLNRMAIATLYPALLRCFVRVLKPFGCAVLMTAEYKTFLRAVKMHEAEARRRAWPFLLTIEPFGVVQGCTAAAAKESFNTAPTDEQRAANVRTVECGYTVYVIVLRKRRLSS